MTSPLYVPVIKGKLNDLKAVGKLDPRLRALTKPLIEAMPLNVEKMSLEKHVFTLCDYVRKHVPLGEVALDFYGLMPDAEIEDGTNAILHGYRLLKAFGRPVTPVFGFERNDSLWVPLAEVAGYFNRGFAIRLRREDLAEDLFDDTWSSISLRVADLGLPESSIDLILDYAEVQADEVPKLVDLTSTFLFSNPRLRHYRSVVVAGSSALRTVSDVAKDDMASVFRSELRLWSDLWMDMPDDLKPIYSDYGVVHPDFSDLGPNQNINGKIRYTVGDQILYFRGHALYKPVKDLDQYHDIARRVVTDPRFRGRSYSYGDAIVADCASRHTRPGSPQTWVIADMNHHLTYTCQQVRRLLAEFALSRDRVVNPALIASV